MSKKNIGIFGGAFNPIHNGHIDVAKGLLDSSLFDGVWFLPCSVHPANKHLADQIHRIRMIELALSELNLSKAGISYHELGSRIHYTFNTMNELSNLHPSLYFNLIIGSDQLKKISGWYMGESLLSKFSLTTFVRNDDSLSEFEQNLIDKYSISVVNIPLSNVSSSMVREKIMCGKSIDSLVPKSVNNYIHSYNIYNKS